MIEFHSAGEDTRMTAGYAYSVENESSTNEIIENICENIKLYLNENNVIRGVNMPLSV